MNYQNEYHGAAAGVFTVGPGIANHIEKAKDISQPRFDAIANSFANLPNGLYKAVARIRQLADRYGGSIPEAVSKEMGSSEPGCLAARLENSAANLESLLVQLHNQIDRLERF